MALYAVNDDDLIYAAEAEQDKIYRCLDCFEPVKKRRGKNNLFHFYHLKASPSCRLYSKTEDHLLAQLQLQKLFPPQTLQMERPFVDIDRVADLCWEQEKIVFEVQCSPITPKEAEMRIRDYRSIGYEVVWLLDDKRYNKRVLRPAEGFLRHHCTYYVSIKQGLTSEYYDQFEIFEGGGRVKKSKRMPVDLRQIRHRPSYPLKTELFPHQITQLDSPQYFYGDRLQRAYQAHISPYGLLNMQNWRTLESHLKQPHHPNRFKAWVSYYIGTPYLLWLRKCLTKLN